MIKLDVLDKEIVVRLKNIRLGKPTVREANGAEHPATPMETRIRKAHLLLPRLSRLQDVRDDKPIPDEEESVPSGTSRSWSIRTLQPAREQRRREALSPATSDEDAQTYRKLLEKAGEDPLDPGGYFIINGTERVLISMEDLAPNRVTVEKNKKYAHETEVAKIFSQRDSVRKPLNVEKRRDGMLMVKIPSAGTTAIPVVLLMRALGMDNDRDIFAAIAGPVEAMKYTVANLNDVKDNEEYGVETEDEALAWLEKKFAAGQQKEYRETRIMNLLDKELLPHLGQATEHRNKKAIFLGRIVRQVLEMAIKNEDPNDKDHYANKRVRLAGDLIEDLFRVSLQQLARDLKYQLERHHNRKRELRINACLRPDVLTSKIVHALATGNWVGGRSGVSQLLDRTTYLAALSHMRRVTSPLVRSQPHFEARDLHPTQWGRLCPNETPEGQNCGLVKNAAQMIDVSEEVPEEDVKALLAEAGVNSNPDGWAEGSRIHVNGDIFGLHKDPNRLVTQFKRRRRQGKIRPEVSLRHDSANRDIFINTDRGRMLRPLLILDGGNLTLTTSDTDRLKSGEWTFNDLVSNGIVEWVDAEEEEDLLIAARPFDLPDVSPKHGRPMNPSKVEWVNLGDPSSNEAHLKVEVLMPDGSPEIEEFNLPLNYHQPDIDSLKRKERKDKTVLIYTHVEIDPQAHPRSLRRTRPIPRAQLDAEGHGRNRDGQAEPGSPERQLQDAPGHPCPHHALPTAVHRRHALDEDDQVREEARRAELRGGDNQSPWIQHARRGHNEQGIGRALSRALRIRADIQRREQEIPRRPRGEDRGPRNRPRRSEGPEGMGVVQASRERRPPVARGRTVRKGEDRDSLPSVLVGKTSPPRFLEESQGAFLQAQRGESPQWASGSASTDGSIAYS